MKTATLPIALLTLLGTWTVSGSQQGNLPPGQRDLSGVYQAISKEMTLPGGLRNSGSPSDIALTPAAAAEIKTVDLQQDPDKMCQPLGPFRMMAREGTKVELVSAAGHGMIVMFFEDLSHGLMRTIYLNRRHPEKPNPNWLGDSIGSRDGDTFVIDTVGFNDRTWLNDAGAQHSEALHVVERIRPVLDGRYLEWKVTAEDPKALAKPYTYTRYYEKIKGEIKEDVCEE